MNRYDVVCYERNSDSGCFQRNSDVGLQHYRSTAEPISISCASHGLYVTYRDCNEPAFYPYEHKRDLPAADIPTVEHCTESVHAKPGLTPPQADFSDPLGVNSDTEQSRRLVLGAADANDTAIAVDSTSGEIKLYVREENEGMTSSCVSSLHLPADNNWLNVRSVVYHENMLYVASGENILSALQPVDPAQDLAWLTANGLNAICKRVNLENAESVSLDENSYTIRVGHPYVYLTRENGVIRFRADGRENTIFIL